MFLRIKTLKPNNLFTKNVTIHMTNLTKRYCNNPLLAFLSKIINLKFLQFFFFNL